MSDFEIMKKLNKMENKLKKVAVLNIYQGFKKCEYN